MTSIEWFVKKIGIINIEDTYYKELFEQAKEMHKQEIIDAYFNGGEAMKIGEYIGMHEYYQETFCIENN